MALGICLTVDLVTKHIAEQNLAMGEVREVIPSVLSLQRTQNDGVAFGLLGGNTGLIVVGNILAMLVVSTFVLLERRPVFAGIVGGAIVGGSLGNFIQRLVGDGHVTDFLKFPNWPNFNAADVFIDVGLAALVIGVVIELVMAYRAKKREAESS